MAMADKIAVMNRGVIEQFGTPQEIYDRPVSMFVADFIGSPPMNFLHCPCRPEKGATSAPDQRRRHSRCRRSREDRAERELALGVRPEHVRFDDASAFRGSVFGAEYLGTTQIVTVETEHGQVKARLSAERAGRRGETVGLALPRRAPSIFDEQSGRAIRTALDDCERGAHG